MVEVEIWSDFACPFCYIGKRNFEIALSKLDSRLQVNVVYRSFELDPNREKTASVSVYELLAKKYGKTVEWAHEMNKNVVATGAAAGLTFNMDLVKPVNTFDAHRLAHFSSGKKMKLDIHDRLFAAYFTNGENIADRAVLGKIALEAGLDVKEVEVLLDSNDEADEVRSDEDRAQQIGVQGVPFFVFDGTVGVSGAQPPEVFLEVFSELGLEARS
ncbi:DsbA family oxidoreductase [soil metagenome]